MPGAAIQQAERRAVRRPLPAPVEGYDPAPLLVDVPDELLIEGLRAREPEALDLLYRRYARLAYLLALRILRDEGAAEDVVQEAFCSAWRQASTYRPERGSLKTWLTSIVHHRAIDRVRGRGPIERCDDLDAAAGCPLPDVADQALRNVAAEQVRAALDALPDEQRQVITLAYFGGWTHVEIAQHVGIPVGTVKGRMRLGLQKLRKQLIAGA